MTTAFVQPTWQESRRGHVPGIPTEYRGVRFRSRLEARWAVFFDLVKWPWEYEPIDLEGYIPDFVLTFRFEPLLVEVKPALELGELFAPAIRVNSTSWPRDVLALGARLFEYHGGPMNSGAVGLLSEREQGPDGVYRLWQPAQLFSCRECLHVSVLSADGSWHCRRCGRADGNAHVLPFDPGPTWLKAGNHVQWRPNR